MAGVLEPRRAQSPAAVTSGLTRLDELRTRRSLSALEARTAVRQASVFAEGLMQASKLQEIDHLGRVAMTGHTMLVRWADTLAAGDPLVRDDLKFFSDVCRMGKGEVIADTIDTFCRESRR